MDDVAQVEDEGWKLPLAILMFGICLVLFILATWSPHFDSLTNPDRLVDYRLNNFIFRGKAYFFWVGMCGIGLTLYLIVCGKFHYGFRIVLFFCLGLVCALLVGLGLFREGVSTFIMVDQELFEDSKFNLVYIGETNHEWLTFFNLVIYQCDRAETNCKPLHLHSLQYDEGQETYYLRLYDTNELVLTDGEFVYWSLELSE